MSSPEGPLPLQPDPLPCESGIGYCLRAAHANGGNLHALRRLIGIGAGAQLSRVHARALAAMLQVSASWLEELLPDKHGLAPRTRRYGGHVFFVHNHLRFRRPQVCPHCIRQRRFCSALWDISLGSVCLEHDCTLIDLCQTCGQAIRWDRPSVDVGHCGHYIQPSFRSGSVTPELMAWQRLLEAIFRKEPGHVPPDHLQWAGTFRDLSLGGVLTLTSAFGCIERPFMTIHTGQSSRSNSPGQWQTVVLRAIDRLGMLQSKTVGDQALAAVVAQPTLMRLLQAPQGSADQQIALTLLEQLFGIEPNRRLLALYPDMGQQRLF